MADTAFTPGETIQYSARYSDDQWEYRHVILPLQLSMIVPRDARLLDEHEWRSVGVQQSRGWVHYGTHQPESYILLFRRPKPDQTDQGGSGDDDDAVAARALIDLTVEQWVPPAQRAAAAAAAVPNGETQLPATAVASS